MKYIIYTIAGVIVAGAIFVLGYESHQTSLAGAVSPNGTTNSITRSAYITFQPATGTATTTSILNPVGNDVIIKTADEVCTGIGSSQAAYSGGGLLSNGLVITAATTSTANPPTLSALNTNYILDTGNVITTTTPALFYSSTSTPGLIGLNATNRIWAANSYLTFSSNATNTMSCTVGVSYLTE